MVGWLQSRNVMTEGMAEKGCSPHGCQEAQGRKEPEKKYVLQDAHPSDLPPPTAYKL